MKRLFLFVIGLTLFFVPSVFAEKKASPKLKSYTFDRPSNISFKAKSTIFGFLGQTTDVNGRFELDLDQLDKPGRGAIEVQAKKLDTQNRKRDKIMRSQHLETNKYPLIRFVIKESRLDFNDPNQKKADYVLKGDLSLHGVTRPVQVIATLDYKLTDNLKIEGYIPIKMTDYQIVKPAFAKVFKLKDEVKVSFNLTAVPNL